MTDGETAQFWYDTNQHYPATTTTAKLFGNPTVNHVATLRYVQLSYLLEAREQ